MGLRRWAAVVSTMCVLFGIASPGVSGRLFDFYEQTFEPPSHDFVWSFVFLVIVAFVVAALSGWVALNQRDDY